MSRQMALARYSMRIEVATLPVGCSPSDDCRRGCLVPIHFAIRHFGQVTISSGVRCSAVWRSNAKRRPRRYFSQYSRGRSSVSIVLGTVLYVLHRAVTQVVVPTRCEEVV